MVPGTVIRPVGVKVPADRAPHIGSTSPSGRGYRTDPPTPQVAAPRVVASLWKVDDQATTELMKRFYRGMVVQRLPAAAALRAAQREIAKQPQWASPFFWAGFVLQGDWK